MRPSEARGKSTSRGRSINSQRRRFRAYRSVVLLFASVVFVFTATVVVHELGHVVVNRIAGISSSMVFVPFGGSYTNPEGPIPPEWMGWTAAAGPGANVLVGLGLFALAWPRRSALAVPLMLWAPVAFIQESSTALVQMASSEPGTDFVVMVEAGVPRAVIIALAVGCLVLGVVMLAALTPLAGLPEDLSFLSTAAVLSAGFAGYYILAMLATTGGESGPPRFLSQLALAVVLSALAAGVAKLPLAHRLTEAVSVSGNAVALAGILAIAALGFNLML